MPVRPRITPRRLTGTQQAPMATAQEQAPSQVTHSLTTPTYQLSPGGAQAMTALTPGAATTPAVTPTQPTTNRNVAQTILSSPGGTAVAPPAYTPTVGQIQPGTAQEQIREWAGVEEGEPLRRGDIIPAQYEADALAQAQAEEDRRRAYELYLLAHGNVGASPELSTASQQLMERAQPGAMPAELAQASYLASQQAGQLPPELLAGQGFLGQQLATGGVSPEVERASQIAMAGAGRIPTALSEGTQMALERARSGGPLGADYLERQQAAIRDQGAMATQDALRQMAESYGRRGVGGSSFSDLNLARLQQSGALGIQQQLAELETQTRLANEAAQQAALGQLMGYGVAGGEAQRAQLAQLAGLGGMREAAGRGLLSDLLGYGQAGAGIQQAQIAQLAGLGGLQEEIAGSRLDQLLGYGMGQQAQQQALLEQMAQIYSGTQREPAQLAALLERIKNPQQAVRGF